MKIFRTLFVCIIFTVLAACEAPHLNPLDPDNPNSKLGQIDGYVKTQIQPQLPIQGVKVSWKNEGRTVSTDATGYFKIENVPMFDGILSFEKDGYSKDSIVVSWNNQKKILINSKTLNAIPLLNNLSIYSGVENRYQNDQRDTLFVKANISDAESDIDSVSIRCTALNFEKKLVYNATKNLYELNYFYGTKNSNPALDNAIGKNFEILVKDHLGKIFNIGSSTIKRVIRQEISFESPANGLVVNSQPVFRWIRFLPGFNFKYLIQIFTDENSPKLVWEKSDISKDDIELIPTVNFNAGNYFWVIWCIDDFQNRTRSKPATFTVQ